MYIVLVLQYYTHSDLMLLVSPAGWDIALSPPSLLLSEAATVDADDDLVFLIVTLSMDGTVEIDEEEGGGEVSEVEWVVSIAEPDVVVTKCDSCDVLLEDGGQKSCVWKLRGI